jgi:hypothetical protein
VTAVPKVPDALDDVTATDAVLVEMVSETLAVSAVLATAE